MNLHHSIRISCVALFLSVAACAAHATPKWCADGKPVKFAGITWESGQFLTEVARIVIEKGYDCKTEVIPGSMTVTQTALLANDLQVYVELWAGRDAIVAQGAKAGKVGEVGSLLIGGTLEGWFVPEYVIKGDPQRGIKPMAPDLKTVADLPKYKALFKDDEEPGKGRFLNCPSGWECEKSNSQKLKAYKLSADYTNFRPGTGGALDATIASAYERGKPVLFYYWAPAGLMGKYKFTQLKEPAFNEACWKTIYNSTVNDPCGSAAPSTNLTSGLSAPFMRDAPELVAFFKSYSLPSELLNRTIAEMVDRKLDAAVVAKEFMQKNKALWKAWMPADVAGKVEKSLN